MNFWSFWLVWVFFLSIVKPDSPIVSGTSALGATTAIVAPVSAAASSPPAPTVAQSYTNDLKKRIDKVGLSGNWIKKLACLKEAVDYDTEIVSFQKEVLTLREQTYEPKIQKINDALRSFKTSSKGGNKGLDDAISQLQDEVDESLNHLEDITKKADAENLQQDARYKFYEAEEKISDYKDKLALLKMNIGFIEDLQKAFENRIASLDSYVDKTKEITAISKGKVEEIFAVFDHEKARDLTFYVKGLSDNIKKIYQYVKEDALKDFDTEQDALSKEIEKLNSETSAIRDDFAKVRAEVDSAEKLLDDSILIADSKEIRPTDTTQADTRNILNTAVPNSNDIKSKNIDATNKQNGAAVSNSMTTIKARIVALCVSLYSFFRGLLPF